MDENQTYSFFEDQRVRVETRITELEVYSGNGSVWNNGIIYEGKAEGIGEIGPDKYLFLTDVIRKVEGHYSGGDTEKVNPIVRNKLDLEKAAVKLEDIVLIGVIK